jgi:hypothetical protein
MLNPKVVRDLLDKKQHHNQILLQLIYECLLNLACNAVSLSKRFVSSVANDASALLNQWRLSS